MKQTGEGLRVTIYVDEKDKWKGKPLYEQIILMAKDDNLAGATATKGFMGFGAKHHLHSAKLLRLSEDLPIVIEIVDTRENMERFLPKLDEMLEEGLVTAEKVHVTVCRKEAKA